jgi:hypothetical protein
LPTIEEEEVIKEKERTGHPAVSSPISLIPTIEITNVDTSLSLLADTEKDPIKFNAPIVIEALSLPASKSSTHSLPPQQPISSPTSSIPSKPAEKKAPIKIIIVGKPPVRTIAQATSLSKEKVQQEGKENIQKKEPIRKIASVAPLESFPTVPQPDPPQAIPQHRFIMPQGL